MEGRDIGREGRDGIRHVTQATVSESWVGRRLGE